MRLALQRWFASLSMVGDAKHMFRNHTFSHGSCLVFECTDYLMCSCMKLLCLLQLISHGFSFATRCFQVGLRTVRLRLRFVDLHGREHVLAGARITTKMVASSGPMCTTS